MNLNTNLVGRKVNIVRYQTDANGIQGGFRHTGEIAAVWINDKDSLRFLVIEPEGRLVTRTELEIRVLETVRVFNKKTGFYQDVVINSGSGLTNV